MNVIAEIHRVCMNVNESICCLNVLEREIERR